MSFLDKLRYRFASFMSGRYGGNDKLNRVMLIAVFVILILEIFINSAILSLISTALIVYSLFRMFSKNVDKRYAENVKFETLYNKVTTEVKQAFIRLKNMKQYKYFKCPKCGSRLRLKRGVGEGYVTCGKCGEKFKQKA